MNNQGRSMLDPDAIGVPAEGKAGRVTPTTVKSGSNKNKAYAILAPSVK